MTCTCVDCKRDFEFTDGEQEFYKEKKLKPPKRCKLCRQKRKSASRYEGWRETMVSNNCRKPRRHRVHYPPHIVGGFK